MRALFSRFWFLSLLIAGTSAYAKSERSYVSANNGIGIAIGDPGGITFFHKMDEDHFIQAYFSQNLLIGADYATVFPYAITAIPELTPFIGGGAYLFKFAYEFYDYYGRYSRYSRYGKSGDLGVGARIPLGLLLQVPNAPIQIHLEIAPSVLVIPVIYSYLDLMIGVRFLF